MKRRSFLTGAAALALAAPQSAKILEVVPQLPLSPAPAIPPMVAGAIGTETLEWSDLFYRSGNLIRFDNGDVTITHVGALELLGGSHDD